MGNAEAEKPEPRQKQTDGLESGKMDRATYDRLVATNEWQNILTVADLKEH